VKGTTVHSVLLNNALRMPSLGLGVFQMKDPVQCEAAVRNAIQSGYRLVDTAAAYGNERAVGRGIRQSGAARNELFVTTKVWPADYGYHRTKQAIARAVERLNAGYIDLMLLHWPFGDVRGSWRALEEAVHDGVVRSIGVSNFTARDLDGLMANATIKPSVDQVERHPYFQQKELTAYLSSNGIVPEAWYPLGHGANELLAEPIVARIANAYAKSPAQVILRWQLQSGYVAIPKSTNLAHLKENIDIYDFELSGSDMDSVAALDRNKSSFKVPRWILGPSVRMMPTAKDLG
jgi:diketogulonate reductase-like aldo/keto reductase